MLELFSISFITAFQSSTSSFGATGVPGCLPSATAVVGVPFVETASEAEVDVEAEVEEVLAGDFATGFFTTVFVGVEVVALFTAAGFEAPGLAPATDPLTVEPGFALVTALVAAGFVVLDLGVVAGFPTTFELAEVDLADSVLEVGVLAALVEEVV